MFFGKENISKSLICLQDFFNLYGFLEQASAKFK